jgi:hypothetical protein
MAPISFIVKRVDGTTEPFSADPMSTLVEVMGADLLANAHVVKDGHVINKYLTLLHENIIDGSIIFLAQRKQPRRRRQSRIEMLAMDYYAWEALAKQLEEKTELEKARISDVIWSGWETSRKHDRMLATMRERHAKKDIELADSDPLVLEKAAEIQDSPLPCCFPADDDDVETAQWFDGVDRAE